MSSSTLFVFLFVVIFGHVTLAIPHRARPQSDGSGMFPPPFQCPKNDGSLFPDPVSCAFYVVCEFIDTIWERVQRMPCPPGLAFNRDLRVCDFRFRVDCSPYGGGGKPALAPPEGHEELNTTAAEEAENTTISNPMAGVVAMVESGVNKTASEIMGVANMTMAGAAVGIGNSTVTGLFPDFGGKSNTDNATADNGNSSSSAMGPGIVPVEMSRSAPFGSDVNVEMNHAPMSPEKMMAEVNSNHGQKLEATTSGPGGPVGSMAELFGEISRNGH